MPQNERSGLAPRITRPDELPVTLAQVKAQLMVDFYDDDTLIDSYLRAAVSHLDGPEGILGRALMRQKVSQGFRVMASEFLLPYGKVLEITALSYYDVSGVQRTLTDYEFLIDDAGQSWLHLIGSVPAIDPDRVAPITVDYYAGWPDALSVPEGIKQAIIMLTAFWYDHREASERGSAMKEVPFGVQDLIEKHRRVGV